MVLKNGTKSLEWWIDSPLKPLLKVHIFNYTNIEAVLSGKEKKIKIEDIGPYVYEEQVERVSLTFLDGNKIASYVSKNMLPYFSKLIPDNFCRKIEVNYFHENLHHETLLKVMWLWFQMCHSYLRSIVLKKIR